MSYRHNYKPNGSKARLNWQQQQGFTLIELLVVMVMAGVLATIALPAFLNQAARARQTKAINAVGAMNRAQHSFFYENAKFSNSINELGFAHLNEEGDYLYEVKGNTKTTRLIANPQDSSLRGYVGLVYLNRDAQDNAILSSLLCQGDQGAVPTPNFTAVGNQVIVGGCVAP
ncbi:MAG: prepilin-type N-terminal cleavage/methylation domain-containing protein [Leptolyngbyaceae cyanobacterium SM2_5_2]|nr:prepilin-type N-terminal cleavage/methylation domain-containing protein [Leptolyngbyaceae cyanobacterium SM2_5_2]